MSDLSPEDWEAVTLSDCLEDFRNGWTYDTRATDGTLPITRIETISNGEIDYAKIGLAQADERIEAFRLRKHDILFSHINSVEHIAKIAMKKDDAVLYHGMNLMRLRPNSRVVPQFIFARLQSKETREHYRASCKRAINQASLNKGEIGNYGFTLPPLEEQRRITEVLRSVDEAIESSMDVFEQGKKVKTGLLQVFFEQEEPSGDGQEKWEERPLGDLVSESITYGVVQPGPSDPDGVLFIRGGDFPNGKIDISSLRTISRVVAAQYKRTQLKGGEILVSLVGYPGACAVVPDELAGANVARQAALIRPNETISTRYLFQFIRSPTGQRRLLSQTMGSAQQVINLKDLREVIVAVPPREEQERIASVLDGFDEFLNDEGSKLEGLKSLKSSLLSVLLSGRVRVPA